VLRATGRWDEAQKNLAYDLLGVRREFRAGCTVLPPDASAGTMDRLVRSELGRLQSRLDNFLLALDATDQAMAVAGMPIEEDNSTGNLRRYEADARRTYRNAKGMLLSLRAQAAARDRGEPAEPPPPPKPVAPRAKPVDRPPTPRPVTSKATMKYLVERARLSAQTRTQVQTPTDTGEVETSPAPHASEPPNGDLAASSPLPSDGSSASHSRAEAQKRHQDNLRRRQRKREKQARKAGRR
jgi:hypothetical protein